MVFSGVLTGQIPCMTLYYISITHTYRYKIVQQVMGMVFSNMKKLAEKNLNASVVDCCIRIPIYFTDLQRRAVMDAASLAGLRPLRLMHEATATALAYGIYKTDLPENEQINIAFVNIGHVSMQVCIVGFKKGQMKILAHSFDRYLGGRDFNEVLFQHFAEQFKTDYKIDVFHNSSACIKLRAACEKLKKVLKSNPEAPLYVECLIDERYVRGFIKRDEFEQISTPILERIKKPLEKALLESQLTVDDIYDVELVGSDSRLPAVIKILTEFYGKEPRRTMNANECVSKGCALECATLGPYFKVKEFQIQESFPFPIALQWKSLSQDSSNGETGNLQSCTIVFPKGNPFPSVKAFTFYRTGTFTLDVQYADASELLAPSKINTYTEIQRFLRQGVSVDKNSITTVTLVICHIAFLPPFIGEGWVPMRSEVIVRRVRRDLHPWMHITMRCTEMRYTEMHRLNSRFKRNS